MKKKLMLCILFVVFLLIGTSCAGNSDANYLKVASGEKYKLSYSERTEEGYVNFLDKLDTFYSALSEELYLEYGSEQDNMAVSPVSIYMALALAIECSNGETREELLSAIGVTYEEVNTYTKKLFSSLNNEYTGETPIGTEQVKALEILTNSIWFEESITLKEVGLNNLANNYNCSSYSAPFEKNNKSANKAFRDYVSKNTKGLIDRDFNLSPETLIALVNTLYLKEIWNDDGDDLPFTSDEYTFTNYNKNTKNLKLLQGYYNLGKAVEEEKYTHFFTKTNHGFNLKFIVPKDGYTVNDIYTKETLEYVNGIKDYKAVDEEAKTITSTRVFFPEYNASFNKDIASVIKNKFGVEALFNPDYCDFSNIIDKEQYLGKYNGIFCSSIIHQTELVVNKKGIEGAAVTIMQMCGDAGPDEEYTKVYLDYIVNRDFAYIITDSQGVVLFTGVVKTI